MWGVAWWSVVVGVAAAAQGTVHEATKRGAVGFNAMLSAYNAVRDTCIFPSDYEVLAMLCRGRR